MFDVVNAVVVDPSVTSSPFSRLVEAITQTTDYLLGHSWILVLLVLVPLAWRMRSETRGKSREEVSQTWDRRKTSLIDAARNTALLFGAAALAWVVTYALGASNGVFAVIAAMVVTSVRVAGAAKASWNVVAATVGGLIIAEIALSMYGPGLTAGLATLLAAVLLGQLLGLGLEGGAATAVTGVIATTMGYQLTDTVAVGRVVSTTIGALIGMGVVWLVNITAPMRNARERLEELSHKVSELLAEIASLTEGELDEERAEELLVTSRELLLEAQDARETFVDASAAARLRGRNAIAAATVLTEEYRVVEHAAESVNNMCRSLFDAARTGSNLPLDLAPALEAASDVWSAHASVTADTTEMGSILERAEEAAEAAASEVRSIDDTSELILSAGLLADMERLLQGPKGDAAAASITDPRLEAPKPLWPANLFRPLVSEDDDTSLGRS